MDAPGRWEWESLWIKIKLTQNESHQWMTLQKKPGKPLSSRDETAKSFVSLCCWKSNFLCCLKLFSWLSTSSHHLAWVNESLQHLLASCFNLTTILSFASVISKQKFLKWVEHKTHDFQQGRTYDCSHSFSLGLRNFNEKFVVSLLLSWESGNV